ncbi:MAG TPA: ABC transporter substrate-binding protein, partial [Thermodesulfobacteriota bacterium]|nr:ABC transporter substrate-binding protein [Thermodesulfobacteriota bacterium]
MRNRTIIFCMTGAFIIILLSLSLSSTINAAEPIAIGVMDPMSGPFKDAGFMTTALSEYVVDQLNAKGGILGRPIKLLKYDTQMKPDVAVRQAKKAILEDGAKFILHHTSSAIALALSKLAQENNVIYVDLGAGADKITGEEFTPNMFRTCLSTTMQSGILAQYFSQTSYKRYYLLNMDYVFGHEAADAFRKILKTERGHHRPKTHHVPFRTSLFKFYLHLGFPVSPGGTEIFSAGI